MFRFWSWLKFMRRDLLLLFFAWRNPATPRYLKVMLWIAIGYLISPIDFVPDYLPVVGIVDDMTVVPAILYAVSRLLPLDIRRTAEASSNRIEEKLPYIFMLLAVLLALWAAFLVWCVYKIFFS